MRPGEGSPPNAAAAQTEGREGRDWEPDCSPGPRISTIGQGWTSQRRERSSHGYNASRDAGNDPSEGEEGDLSGRWIIYRGRGEEERVGDVWVPVERSSTTRGIYMTFECGAFTRWKPNSVGWERYCLPGARIS